MNISVNYRQTNKKKKKHKYYSEIQTDFQFMAAIHSL